ncbi:hypothetical protein M9194_13290 [Vibrio sp. S4M6]|uniref:hypothetical protein n=1 Tax=Vibrio sinus TaxID=2946865 RepID=UPI002029F22F|nr:hypothetical protein [Vibrio sinus]MCL9782402.1 hypothetical protein [Vibrio sinus]
MSVFTIFFHGTGSSSTDLHNTASYYEGELISRLASMADGRLFFDYLEVDGVGSGNQDEWLKPVNNRYRNQKLGMAFGAGIQSNMEYAKGILIAEQNFSKFGKGHYEVRAKKLLHSTSDKEEIRELAADLFRADKSRLAHLQRFRWENPVTTVNLIGWSRGGVSCFEFANYLFSDPKTRNLNVNIFACDPVPGGTNQFKNFKNLNANVRQIVCLFAENEQSTGFRARMPTLHRDTKSYVSFVPGRHATLVGNAHADGGKKGSLAAKGPYLLTRDFAQKALTGWGTRLRNINPLDQSEMTVIYNTILGNKQVYDKMGATSYIPSYHSLKNAYWSGKSRTNITQRVKYDSSRFSSKSSGKIDGLDNRNEYKPFISKHHRDTVLGQKYVLTGNPQFIDVSPFVEEEPDGGLHRGSIIESHFHV